jgi:hypothetical protein
MLAIQARCHAGHIHISHDALPLDAKVVVVFLPPDASHQTPDMEISMEQQAALMLQSQSCFAQNVLLHPAEDCWNDA